MKTPWIGTSWKMNKTRAEARAFAEALRASPFANTTSAQPFVIPPFPYIADVSDILSGTRVRIGAQNMHWADQGAWTGEVSPLMIKDCGATLVELGHSERRTHFGETDETVARKVAAALRHGLIALVCIGDTLSEYQAGATADVLARQTRYALRDVGKEAPGKVILAYEPVWSIGEGGIPADPAFANAQHGKLKALTAELAGQPLPILYGGSVNPQNCCELITKPYIDGLFIGRSAWHAPDFIAIIETVTTLLGEPT
jgi:L-erythrulose 1-phosphate isomerase